VSYFFRRGSSCETTFRKILPSVSSTKRISSPAFHPLSRTRSFGSVILYCPLFSTILMERSPAVVADPSSLSPSNWDDVPGGTSARRFPVALSTKRVIDLYYLNTYWVLEIYYLMNGYVMIYYLISTDRSGEKNDCSGSLSSRNSYAFADLDRFAAGHVYAFRVGKSLLLQGERNRISPLCHVYHLHSLTLGRE
jgi:hypothetical protein